MATAPVFQADVQQDIDAIDRIPAVPAILEVVCGTTGMGFAAVARVTSERWVACRVLDRIAFGLKPGSELKLETTICNEIRQSGKAVIIDHVAQDAVFSGHGTPALYGFQSYISMPIVRRDGTFFGTLCAIDPNPAKLNNPQTIGMFKLFADLIAFHLDAQQRIETSEASLMDARATGKLREEFIAVLGHDLRNPLASIVAGTRLLAKDVTSEKGRAVLKMMQASVDRMAGLIENVLDLARGRLGGGLSLNRGDEHLEPILGQVVDELKSALPGRAIDAAFALPQPVNCDRSRVAQLFSNLLGNALTHGASGPVTARAAIRDGFFELSVANTGAEIPPAALTRLFQPYERSKDARKEEGLGLYIAWEIARAHGGTLEATSSPQQTCFTFRMPVTR